MKNIKKFNEYNRMNENIYSELDPYGEDDWVEFDYRELINFVATRENIEKLVDKTRYMNRSDKEKVSYLLGPITGPLYGIIMKNKYNVSIGI